MKTNYFTHRLFPADGSVISQPISDSLQEMISNGANSTMMAGEYYVIQHLGRDVYTLIKTNSKDVFRKLNVKNKACVDLSKILNSDEKIAFASFFIVKGNVVGFSSTLHSPRINKLAELYDLFMFSKNHDHNINFTPITIGVTPHDVMQCAHVGKITMKIEKNQKLIDGLSAFFSGNVKYDDVDSFEIKIIPKRRKDIKDTFSGVITQLPPEVMAVAVSAKEKMGDLATDLNVISANTVYDLVTDSSTIVTQMEDNFATNATLRGLGY
ncbi:hypothetical protein ACVGA5_003339 [Morganella morganii]